MNVEDLLGIAANSELGHFFYDFFDPNWRFRNSRQYVLVEPDQYSSSTLRWLQTNAGIGNKMYRSKLKMQFRAELLSDLPAIHSNRKTLAQIFCLYYELWQRREETKRQAMVFKDKPQALWLLHFFHRRGFPGYIQDESFSESHNVHLFVHVGRFWTVPLSAQKGEHCATYSNGIPYILGTYSFLPITFFDKHGQQICLKNIRESVELDVPENPRRRLVSDLLQFLLPQDVISFVLVPYVARS